MEVWIGSGGDRGWTWWICCGDQGGAAGNACDVCGGTWRAGWDMSQRWLHTLQGHPSLLCVTWCAVDGKWCVFRVFLVKFEKLIHVLREQAFSDGCGIVIWGSC